MSSCFLTILRSSQCILVFNLRFTRAIEMTISKYVNINNQNIRKKCCFLKVVFIRSKRQKFSKVDAKTT